jgi:phenylpropionate dioxygenase-like ring-hydroxylating dioxygenase large terminal subunit
MLVESRADTAGRSAREIVREVADRLERGYTPTAEWYFDPSLYAVESERIFDSTWQLVAVTTDLPEAGSFVTVTLREGREYIIVRGNDGGLRGFANVCPHRANALLSGCGSTRLIQCGYHGWTYRLDGALHHAPGMDRVSGFDPSEIRLYPVSVDVWEPFVFLNPDADAPPLGEFLGELPDRVAELGLDLSAIARHGNAKLVEGILECNWKIAVENALECYHCPTAHPGLAATIDLPRWKIDVRGNCVIQGTHMNPTDKLSAKQQVAGQMGPAATRAALASDGSDLAWFHWIFPNNSISVWPGPANSFNVARWIPLGPNRTRWWSVRWWPADVPDQVRDEQWDFICAVGWEDQKIVEGVYRGVTSNAWKGARFQLDPNRYEPGLLPARDERGPHQFNQLVARQCMM